MNILFASILAFTLSLDAFSLSISIGTMMSIKNIIKLSLIVGLFHFIMPTLGTYIGTNILSAFILNSNLFSCIIFLFIAYEMFKEFREYKNQELKISLLGMIIFALGVSLDSFGVGLTLPKINFLYFLIFSLFSFLFTLLGLLFGKLLNKLVGKYSILIGSIIMFSISIVNLCKI